MKVNIEVSMDDIARMLSETEQHTPLEVALMRKCMKLFENLERTNNEKNRLFGVVYRNYLAIDRMFGDAIRSKRKNELANESKRMFANAVRLNAEATKDAATGA
jgi:hypothetical protein